MSAEKPVLETKYKPIYLYDHLPGILAGYPAILLLLLAFLSLPYELDESWKSWRVVSPHAIFWIGVGSMVVWYIAYTYNLPKGRFWLVFGLLGTFVGIPAILELTGYITPFAWLARMLGALAPTANAGAWLVGALVFGIIWLCNLVWSRTHLSVRLDEGGLTIKRVGGKGERFDLIGLKTEHEPLDYLETFIAGVGSLSLKTRMNKPIFTMKRVIGLYRTPLFPFFKGKLARIDEMLGFHGKVLYVAADERAEIAEAGEETNTDNEFASADEPDVDAVPADDRVDVDTTDSPDIR